MENVREYLKRELPPGLAANIQWEALKQERASFVDERLAHCSSDLLFSVRLRGKPVFLYLLFEHQSTVDPNLIFRLLVYMVRIWEHWLKTAGPGQKAPCIVPLVLHQGGEQWTISTQFRDWLELPEEGQAKLGPFVPDFQHWLIDLSRIPMERIGGKLILRLAVSLLKAAREDGLEEWLERFAPSFIELVDHPDKMGVFRAMMMYVFAVDSKAASTLERFVAKISNSKVKEGVMSIAEQLIQRGRQEGRQEGLLVGQIQLCQNLLGLAVMSADELAARDASSLRALLSELQARLQNRVK